MESPSDIVLQDLPNYLGTERAEDGRLETTQNRPGQHEFSLPQADGGKGAWLFLAACFIVEALVWGFPFSFGVFQEYYSTHGPISSDSSGVAIIGTTATGVMYTIGVILFPAYKQWPKLATRSKWAGLPIMATALIAGSFANKVSHLVLTQGVLYAIGGSVIYYPTLMFLDEWFIQRKGLAYGIMWAGTGTAGLIIPFVMNFLLSTYGFRTTLRVWAVALIILSGPLIYFLHPRLPISPVSQPQRHGLGFLKTSTFWIFLMGVVMESLGFFIPSLYLPTYARSLGLSPSIGTLLVALVNASGVVSTILGGFLIDRIHVTSVIALSTVGTAIAVFLFWGLSTALPLLCMFSILYGFFAGGFVSSFGGVVKVVKQMDERADVGTLLGLLSAGRGIGAVVSGPMSEALIKGKSWQGQAGLAYGSEYGSLIVFTGITATVGGVSFVGKRLGWV